jgi:hypothetical protein
MQAMLQATLQCTREQGKAGRQQLCLWFSERLQCMRCLLLLPRLDVQVLKAVKPQVLQIAAAGSGYRYAALQGPSLLTHPPAPRLQFSGQWSQLCMTLHQHQHTRTAL